MDYYVYQHIRLDTNTPFYVGKGKNDRSTNFTSRNKHWKKLFNQVDGNIKSVKVKENLNEEQALKFELELYTQYVNEGYKLINVITPGKKGSSGHKKSKEWKEQYSHLMSLKNRGRKLTSEHKNNLSKSLMGRKGTRDKKVYQYSKDGIFIKEWKNQQTAEKSFKTYLNGKFGSGINACCVGKQKSAHGFIWRNEKPIVY